MYLKKLHLVNFKNYPSAEIEFSEGVNCFVGENGTGKTNLMDAIHYLSLCKSCFNPVDSQNILHKTPFFVIQGEFNNNEKIENIYCGLKANYRKQFKRNDKQYEKLADHIGLIPIVMITPSDMDLVAEGSEVRRKFLDTIIAQYDKIYLENLIEYNHALIQRNSLLKQFAERDNFEAAALEPWDEKIVSLSERIFQTRKDFLNEFCSIFQKFYKDITGNKEHVFLEYQSQLNLGNIKSMITECHRRDRILQRTTVGVHKDDLIFKISSYPLKRVGSQGQQKSYVVALKLAQFDCIKERKGTKPILILDDIYDRLDDFRVGRLMNMIAQNSFGQVFITDTHPQRLRDVFEKINVVNRVFEVKNGTIEKQEQVYS